MSEDCENIVCRESPFGQYRKNLAFLGKGNGECPLNKQQLGLYSWSLLHTFSVYYPITPTQQDKRSILGILEGFKNLYPCTHCRKHFQKDYQTDPPQVENQQELMLWVCRQHNYVNKLLGKKAYACEYQSLLKRWKIGCDKEQL